LPTSGGDLCLLEAPVPTQQLVQALNGMIGDAGEHVSEPGSRIDISEFGGDN
jgi:hypothetical protein